MDLAREFTRLRSCRYVYASLRSALHCATVNDLPALLLAGGMFGDFLGGLLILGSIISMLEIKFSIDGSPKKRSKK